MSPVCVSRKALLRDEEKPSQAQPFELTPLVLFFMSFVADEGKPFGPSESSVLLHAKELLLNVFSHQMSIPGHLVFVPAFQIIVTVMNKLSKAPHNASQVSMYRPR